METNLNTMHKELITMDLWAIIDDYIKTHNLLQKEFAEKVGISEDTLSKIKHKGLTGKRQLQKIADFFNLDIKELWKEAQPDNQNVSTMEDYEELKRENEALQKELLEVYRQLYEREQGKKPGRAGTGS